MKRLLLLIAVSIVWSGSVLQAQEYEYVPLVREGIEWGYKNGEIYRFIGEEIINGKVYKQLGNSSRDYPDSYKIAGYAREENKVVYRLYSKDAEEVPIYDFNVKQVGDIMQAWHTEPGYFGMKVESLDSILVNGKYRKMIKQYKLRFYNFRLVIFLLAISTFGIILVGSAREDLKSKQLVGVILGLIIMVILSLMDYSWISNFQWIMYGANIVLLLIVRLFGDSANGAARWIDFGFIRFQPTELSKIIIILFFARFFMDHEEDLNTFKTLAKSVILLAIPLFLIYEQPDMKNTLMLLAVFCILIYIAGLSYKIIGGDRKSVV